MTDVSHSLPTSDSLTSTANRMFQVNLEPKTSADHGHECDFVSLHFCVHSQRTDKLTFNRRRLNLALMFKCKIQDYEE